MCNFFHHNPSLKHSKYVVEIKGFGRKLLPVQAHAVYWALLRMHDVHSSVILGHVMGIGKTTIAIAVHHVQHLFNLISQHIADNPNSHWLKENPGNSTCPSNSNMLMKFGFDCICVPGSPSHFMGSAFGVTVALVPQGLINVWLEEWNLCFPRGQNPFHMEVIRAHKYDLSPQELQLVIADRDEKKMDNSGTPTVPEIYPTVNNSRCFILTTSHSFESKLKKRLTFQDENRILPPPVTSRNPKTGQARQRQPKQVVTKSQPFTRIVIGTVLRDECHLERNEGSKTITTLTAIQGLAGLIKVDPPHLVCLSGTPITTGPADLSHYIKAMVRPKWAKHKVLRHWIHSEAVELGKTWEALCKNGRVTANDSQTYVDHFRPLVEELMVRFTAESNFLGTGPVVRIPENVLVHVKCQLTAEWECRLAQQKVEEDRRIQEQENRRQKRYRLQHSGNMSRYQPLQQNRPSSYYRARLCASFPYLMDLTDQEGHLLKLTEKEWIDKTSGGPKAEWQAGTNSDPYFAACAKIFDSSAKLREIGQIWHKFKGIQDAEKQPARLIFCSYFFAGSYILYLVRYALLAITKSARLITTSTLPTTSKSHIQISHSSTRLCNRPKLIKLLTPFAARWRVYPSLAFLLLQLHHLELVRH